MNNDHSLSMENLLELHQQRPSGLPAVEEFALEDYERTMTLDLVEIQRALIIKEAVEAGPHLAKMTDFEYVQYALTHPTTHGTTAEAAMPLSTILEHIARMQAFCRQYQIQETADEGAQMWHEWYLEQPGHLLALLYLPSSGSCTHVSDMKALFPRLIKTERQWRILLAAVYYRSHAMAPHFRAMRQGESTMFECQGTTFQNYEPSFCERLFHEILISYPKRHKEMFFLHSPMVINIAYGLLKQYMNQNMKETFHLGYSIPGLEGRRIDELFKVPDEETALRNTVDQVHQLLTIRYRNQTQFQILNYVSAHATTIWRQLVIQPLMQQPQEQELQQE
jgi:CRAL/TRIO domain